MGDFLLTPHFSMHEMIVSEIALRHGIPNDPPESALASLERLCRQTLEPLRAYINAPLNVTSGYRSPLVNRLVGGSPRSQHCLGEAADFRAAGFENRNVLALLVESGVLFDQAILEFGPAGWVHVSYRVEMNRRQTLEASSGPDGTVYTPLKP
jgi:zinc D-Ala-D-Ala carboxypeptidase